MATIAANGTTLYYERRGDGPPLLFISGATGDAGHWGRVVDQLADEYTVVSYDRRANSRSPRPADQTTAPIDEQADDAAALLEALDLAPALVVGNSQGALILTSLALRHPEVLRGAVFHEPPYVAMTSDPAGVGAVLEALIGEGMARGGPPAAVDAFWRVVGGDEVWDGLDPDLRSRLTGNGEVLFAVEMESITNYLPTPAQLAEIDLPRVVAAGVENRDPAAPLHWLYEGAQWLAGGLRVPLVEMPGAHVPQLSHPREFVATLRPILAELAAARSVQA